jgi:hemerythrin
MIYNWDESLKTGDERIDSQHKQLINALNKLIIAHRDKLGSVELASTLEFMKNYVIQHFHDEEQLQLQYKYPKYEEHKNQHSDFKFVVKDLLEQMQQQGYTDALVEKTIRTVAQWLIMHIKSDDLKLAIYIQQKESQKDEKNKK